MLDEDVAEPLAASSFCSLERRAELLLGDPTGANEHRAQRSSSARRTGVGADDLPLEELQT